MEDHVVKFILDLNKYNTDTFQHCTITHKSAYNGQYTFQPSLVGYILFS